MAKYNGWRNYETWNVALWIGGQENLYARALAVKRLACPYHKFREGLTSTPDGVNYFDAKLDIDALEKMIREL